MNTENSKTNEPHKCVLNLSQRLDLTSSNKLVVLQYLSNYYTWNNVRQQYKNGKLKNISLMWDDELELHDCYYSVSDIQNYVEYIIKKHETLLSKAPINI